MLADTRRIAGASGLLAALVLSPLATATLARGPESGSAAVVVYAHLATHTQLRVSSSQLVFDARDGEAATASVDFAAAARTTSGGEVLLTVESDEFQVAAERRGPNAAATIELDGAKVGTSPTIARRWVGSGMRQGRLHFTLRGAAPGTYMVPVKFVLTAP